MKRILSLLAIVAMTTVFGRRLVADDCSQLLNRQYNCCGQPIYTQLCQYGFDAVCCHLCSFETCDCNGVRVWSDRLGGDCLDIRVAVSARPDSASFRVYAPTCTGAYASVIVGG